MLLIKRILGSAYWLALGCLALYTLATAADWNQVFHMAFYIPAIGMLTAISGQIDLLRAVEQGKKINIKAGGKFREIGKVPLAFFI